MKKRKKSSSNNREEEEEEKMSKISDRVNSSSLFAIEFVIVVIEASKLVDVSKLAQL